jgi:hypothetical protein
VEQNDPPTETFTHIKCKKVSPVGIF